MKNTIIDDKCKLRLLRFSTYSTVAGVFLIIFVKLIGWFQTNSLIILASLTDSLLDVCVSIVNLIAVHYSLVPADKEHRFGHTKIEDIAVFLQSFFFGFSGLYLIYESLHRLTSTLDHKISNLDVGIRILIISTIITFVIVSIQSYVMKKAKSNVIEADSKHYIVDFITNISAILGIFLAQYFQKSLYDSAIGLFLAVYIIHSAYGLFKKSFNNLMDHEMAVDEKQIVIDIIQNHKMVLGFHDLKTRYAGVKPFIQFHIELDRDTSLKLVHQISQDIEQAILQKFPSAEIIIHPDPDGVEENITYKD